MSESVAHNSLAEALLAFQAEAPTLHKDSTAEVVSKRTGGKFTYKYVDLASILEAVGGLLEKHGLVWQAFPCLDGNGKPALRYKLTHGPSGESDGDTMSLPVDGSSPQAMGSAITYARRYALVAVLNLAADDDDDGAGAKAAQDASVGSAPIAQLPDVIVQQVLAAIREAQMPTDWLRMQLVAVGATNVPEGQIMLSTIQALTEEQADRLLIVCAEVSEARQGAVA